MTFWDFAATKEGADLIKELAFYAFIVTALMATTISMRH